MVFIVCRPFHFLLKFLVFGTAFAVCGVGCYEIWNLKLGVYKKGFNPNGYKTL